MKIAFHPAVDLLFSTKQDGSMARHERANENTESFLDAHGFPTQRSLVYITYGDDRHYTDTAYVSDTETGSIACDALYTDTPGRVLVLPVADCVGTVVYDPNTSMLGLLHLGRHSSVAGLIESFAIDTADKLGSDPRDWHVWMSPSIRSSHDLLDYFDQADSDEWAPFVQRQGARFSIDTIAHNTARFLRMGVQHKNIQIDPRNTYTDDSLYSHRAAVEMADPTKQGRMIVAVRLR